MSLTSSPLFITYGFAIASAVMGLGVLLGTWRLLTIASVSRQLPTGAPPFEEDRRQALRSGSGVYRACEPLIDELVGLVNRFATTLVKKLEIALPIAREPLPWTGAEVIAVAIIEAVLVGLTITGLFGLIGKWGLGGILGSVIALLYVRLKPKGIEDRAAARAARIRLRLPFAVDLIALMMEAGGGFQECLQTAVVENGGHPLTEELAEVLRQISLGRPRRDALRALDQRLQNDDISEMVFAINKGEELGTPLSVILRDQANQMRIKRSQRGEKAAAEAQVKIVFPGMVTMIAGLLVVIAPIVLPAILALF